MLFIHGITDSPPGDLGRVWQENIGLVVGNSYGAYLCLNALLDALQDGGDYPRTLILTAAHFFQLAGHTCNIGSDAYNQRLSERRARAVQDWLVKKGYPANRLQVTGFGKTKSVADNSTEEGRKLNRRVEIRTIVEKQ